MSVKIETPQREGDLCVFGRHTHIWIDGRELQKVTNIKVEFPVDGPVRYAVECFAAESMDIQTEDERIDLTVTVLPGYRLIKDEYQGRVVYHCEREVPMGEERIVEVVE